MNKEYKFQGVREEFEYLVEIFGIGSKTWDEMHTTFSWSYFCPANEKSFIAEYLLLEDFVQRAKLCGFIYYQLVDDFLEVYHDAVYSRLNLTKGMNVLQDWLRASLGVSIQIIAQTNHTRVWNVTIITKSDNYN